MPAAYDTYDYPSYWIGREYEHEAEVNAIGCFLGQIKKVKKALEIGAGYGRLTPHYLFRSNKVILSDPSSKLLKIARKNLKGKNVSFIHSKIENLDRKIRKNSVDLVLMIRVLHHIKDPEDALKIVKKILKKNGYLILEFANKRNMKTTVIEMLKGNLTYPLDIMPNDKSRSKNSLPFKNYHPDQIKEILNSLGFKIVEIRSVSNTRNEHLKHFIPRHVLIEIEKLFQKILSIFNFGPSIFILARNNSNMNS